MDGTTLTTHFSGLLTKAEARPFHTVAVIFLFAVAVRVAPVIALHLEDPTHHQSNLNEIEFYYDDVARSVTAGKGFVHGEDPNPAAERGFERGTPFSFVPPLYAFIVAAVYAVFGPNVFVAKLFTAGIDAGVCIAVYCLAYRLASDRAVSFLASFLYAVYPFAILQAGKLQYQVPMNLTYCLLVYFLVTQSTRSSAVWGGIALGLSTLAKPITLPLIALVPVIKVVQQKLNSLSWGKSISWGLIFASAAVLVLTPWTIRNYVVFDEFVPVQKGGPQSFHIGSKEEYIDTDVATLRSKYRSEFEIENKMQVGIENHLNRLKSDPFGYVKFLLKKFSYTWYNTEGKDKNELALIVQVPFLMLALVGLVVSARRWSTWDWAYMLGAIAFVVGIQVVFFPLLRYTLVVMPLVLIFSAVGTQKIMSHLFRRSVPAGS